MGRLSIIFLFLLLIPCVSAALPKIGNVAVNASNFDPKEGSIIRVGVYFNATDDDLSSDLNNSACQCVFDNNVPWQGLYESAEDTSCTFSVVNATTYEYHCEVDMLFWYEPTTYSINVTAGDNQHSYDHDASATFTYNILLASDIDSSVIDFGSLSDNEFSTDITDTNSPFVINNTGNRVIDLNVSGADLADSGGISDNVSVSYFFVDTDSDISGSTQLSYSSIPISGSSVPVATSGGDGLEQLWWFFTVPSALPFGTYSGLWTLDES